MRLQFVGVSPDQPPSQLNANTQANEKYRRSFTLNRERRILFFRSQTSEYSNHKIRRSKNRRFIIFDCNLTCGKSLKSEVSFGYLWHSSLHGSLTHRAWAI
jgi:hypothetical protein